MSQDGLREKELRLLEAGFAPAAVYVAVSLALAGILITRTGFTLGGNASSYAVGCFLLSAVFFFFAMDFTLLAMWYEEHRPSFGLIINALYSLGQILIPIGISFSILAISTRGPALVFMGVYIVGFLAFNITRLLKIGLESPVKTRLILRAFSLVILALACILIIRG